ncbi:hypothetical protein J2125_003288 [Erwinia toletana]|uniref:Uncharacterized protein n=1 Tax=Winslowiella toletana TaxID=92490 RepID=A0ABS4PDC8_9GAMM|nr:hypothetical protein [Winslowiella toletana]
MSDYFGFDLDVVITYIGDIQALQKLWQARGYVEVYEHIHERRYGMIKDSNSTLGSSPYYIGLYHGRVLPDDHDPLLVISFQESPGGKILVIENMITHDDMFGASGTVKHSLSQMRAIRKRLRDKLDEK